MTSLTTKNKLIVGNLWLAFFAAGIALAFDFASKYLTYLYLPNQSLSNQYPYGGIPVFKDFFGIEFSLIHTTNHGAAWGILADYQSWLLIVRICLVLVLIAYLFFSAKEAYNIIPMTLIVAGAIGNILDYFIYGHVIDMFHFIFWSYDYPVFNVADSCIFIGICWLFFSSGFAKKVF